jgi:hypothetical protein
MSEAKHTPGPWGCTTRQGSWDWVVFSEETPNIEICQMFHDDTEFNETGEANSHLVAAAPDLLTTARNAAATIAAIYEWVERVENAGGATSIPGVAACNSMLVSLRKNAERAEALVMKPLRDAIAKAEGRS